MIGLLADKLVLGAVAGAMEVEEQDLYSMGRPSC
jgi:hypothetical protein